MKITWFATGDDTNISSMNSNTLHACNVHLNMTTGFLEKTYKNHAMSTKKGIYYCAAPFSEALFRSRKSNHTFLFPLSLSLALAAIGCRDIFVGKKAVNKGNCIPWPASGYRNCAIASYGLNEGALA